MNDSGVVRCLERATELDRERGGFVGSHGAVPFQPLAQRLAVDVGHRDVGDPVALAEIVDAKDVLVGDLAGEQDFSSESFADLGLLEQFRPDDLQRHVALQSQVAGPVDDPHPALAQYRGDLEAVAEHGPGLHLEARSWRRRGLGGTYDRGCFGGVTGRRGFALAVRRR